MAGEKPGGACGKLEKGQRKAAAQKNLLDDLPVVDITYKNKYIYDVLFRDGLRAEIDFLPLIRNCGAMKPLLNKNLFKSAWVRHGTVVWSDDLDVAPEWLWAQAVSKTGGAGQKAR